MQIACLSLSRILLVFANIGLTLVSAVQTQAQQCTSMTIQPVTYLQDVSLPTAQPATGQMVAAPIVVFHSTGGPGTEMTQIINRMGLGSDCSRCKALATQMDQRGPEWVQQNRSYVVQHTISNAENLGHRMGPAKKLGVRRIVNQSVRRSR